MRRGPDPPRRARRRPRRRARSATSPRCSASSTRRSADGARLLPAARAARPPRRVQGAPPRGLAGDARRAARDRLDATTRSSCGADGLLVGYLETEDFEAARRRRWRRTDVNARWQAEMAQFFELRQRAARHRPRSGSRRCSTLPDAPATPRSTSARERPRRRRPPRRRARRARGASTASRTGPCGCPTGCAGTCCTCSPRRSRACARRRRPLRGRRRRHAGASTTRCSTARGRVLGLPFHYRDERTEGMIERAFARVAAARAVRGRPASRRCRSTPSSSCSPTRARPRSPPPSGIALVPDLLALLAVAASSPTSRPPRRPPGCSTPARGAWAHGARSRGSGCPARLFGALVEPGTPLGPAARAPRASATPRSTPSPATTPPRRSSPRRCATSTPRSCRAGTWSLLGARARRAGARPTPRARRTSPTSAASTARRGCSRTSWACGCWQECRRAWPGERDSLRRAAPARRGGAPATCRCSTPTTRRSSRPATCRRGSPPRAQRAGQREPRDRGETVRAILVSLACKYRCVLERLEAVSGRDDHAAST